MHKSTFLTHEGFARLQNELHELKTVKRKEIALRIQEAKELGDLSENAEYVEAKNEQSFIEGRVVELESILKNAQIIEPTAAQHDVVQVGSRIRVKNGQEEQEYVIVGSSEADPAAGKISNESPLGAAFIGRKIGDVVAIDVPRGQAVFEILALL